MNTDLDVSRHYSRRNLRDRVNAPFGGGVYFGPTCGFGLFSNSARAPQP
jgi:hypothetical protein